MTATVENVDAEQVDEPTMWEQVCTPRVSVDDCAKQLADHIGSFINTVRDPLERYMLRQRWRAVYERAATELTSDAADDLCALKNAGNSPQRISAMLTDSGCPISKSGVEQAIKKRLATRVDDDEAVMGP